jgi:hypothetical protein
MADRTSDESPVMRARRLRFSFAAAGVSDNSREHIRRVADQLPLPLVEILDREQAPFCVCRHIAWAGWVQDRFVRLALALHLRREVNESAPSHSASGWAWLKDREASAAERVWRSSAAYARLVQRGVLAEHGKTPSFEQIRFFGTPGSPAWETIWGEVSSLDRTSFMLAVDRLVAARKRRRPPRRRKPLSADQVAILDALKVLGRAVVDGRLTADALPALADRAERQPPRAR